MPTTFWARTDSASANNPALNLTGDAALSINFVASGGSGDFILEQPIGGGVDPDTQVEIGGTAYDFIFELSGTMPTLKKDGSQQVPDQFEGEVVYIITIVDYPTAGDATRMAFMPDQTATQAEMDAFGNGAIDIQGVDNTPPPGTICFAQGTLILTPAGNTKIEALKIGDLVMTLDHGPKPILWISMSEHAWPNGSENGLPIAISRDAFGPGKPLQDLVVSPQHKVLVLNKHPQGSERVNGELAPAKGLATMAGVRTMKGKRSIVYYHMLFETHQIVFSNGLETESFFPGPMAMASLTRTQRDEIYALCPNLRNDQANGYGPGARDFLTCRQAREHVAARRSHDQNQPQSIDRLMALAG